MGARLAAAWRSEVLAEKARCMAGNWRIVLSKIKKKKAKRVQKKLLSTSSQSSKLIDNGRKRKEGGGIGRRQKVRKEERMKPTLEIFPGGSRSPDVLAAEPPRSARDPHPREFFGWSELDVSRRASEKRLGYYYGELWEKRCSISKKCAISLSRMTGVVFIKCIMDGFCVDSLQ